MCCCKQKHGNSKLERQACLPDLQGSENCPALFLLCFDLKGAERIKHALVNLKNGSSNPLKNLLQSSDGSWTLTLR